MKIELLLKEIRELGIVLTVKDDNIKIMAPQGALTPEIIANLKRYKPEIIRNISEEKGSKIPLCEPKDGYYLSFEQRRIWLLSQREGGNKAYVIYFAFEVNGPLNTDLLAEAIHLSIKKHEILRTVFRGDHFDDVRQHIIPFENMHITIPVHDFREEKEPLEKCYEQYTRIINQPFSFDDFLFRIEAAKISDTKTIIYAVMHHIIIDGWSSKVFFKEIMEIYYGLLRGENPEQSTLPFQYKDFSEWQYKNIGSAHLAKQLNYWKQQFSDKNIPELEIFPSKSLRHKNFIGKNTKYSYSKELTHQLRTFTAQQSIPVFNILLTAVNILLYRYSNQNTIIIGTPVSTRSSKEFENQLGIYQNTMALRSTIAGNETLGEIITKVNRNLLDAYANSDYPFDLWVEELNVKPSAGRSVLFDVLIAFQKEESFNGDLEFLPELNIKPWNAYSPVTSKYDLVFDFFEAEENLTISIDFNPDLYEISFVENMFYHVQNILKGLLQHPETLVDQLDFLSDEDKLSLSNTQPQRTTELSSYTNVVDLFRDRVQKNPKKIAVSFKDETLTFEEVEELSNKFANFLLNQYSIKNEDLIGLVEEKSLLTIPILLGILKTGAAYVPIDSTYPEERIAYLTQSVNCKALIDGQFVERFLNNKDTLSSDKPDVAIEQNHLFHVMFTSGTTGNPKGVMIEHGNIINLIQQQGYLKLNENTVLLSTVSISFDTTNTEFWSALINGGHVILAEKKDLLDYAYFKSLIKKHHVNTLWLTASWFQHVVETDIELFEGLSQFITGGDVVSARHVSLLKERYPDLTIINGYGPTENTTFSTYHEITSMLNGNISIGKPLEGTQVYILNKEFIPQPKGIVGNLFVAGANLSRGYFGNPKLTEEKFIGNPFQKGKLMYDTGDLARWLPDGSIEFIGRKEKTIKIRGKFIDTVEIENTLCKIDDIRQAVVLVQDIKGEKKIVAYTVNEQKVNIQEVKAILKRSLPEFMIPEIYVSLETIPLSHNGKVDRVALASKIELQESVTETSHITLPVTDTEKELIELYKIVLKLDEVCVTDDFFELGGYSLTAITLLAKISEKLGKKISIKELYIRPAIKELAQYLDSVEKIASEGEIIPVEQEFYPLSYAQKRMWIKNYFNKTHHNDSIAHCILHIDGDYEPDQLSATVKKMIDRQHILRSVFPFKDGEPSQYVMPTEEAFDKIFECKEAGDKEIDAAFFNALSQSENFDLTEKPPIRVRLFLINDKKAVLFVQLQHIAYDAWSMKVLYEEFTALLSDHHLKLPLLSIQYKHYAYWENEKINNNEFDKELKYWEKALSDLPDFTQENSSSRGKSQSDNVSIEFSKEDIPTVILSDNKVDDIQLFLAAVTLSYGIVFKKNDFICNFPYLGRKNLGTQNLIGLFYQIIPLRIKLDNTGIQVGDFINNLNALVYEGIENINYPFEKLIDEILELKKHTNVLSLNVVSKQFVEMEPCVFNNGKAIISADSIEGDKQFRTDITFDLHDDENKFMLSCTFDQSKYSIQHIQELLHLIKNTILNWDNMLEKALEEHNNEIYSKLLLK
ncbi:MULTISPECIES: non-ribosomal peptide synthetase [Chryseobacterium]|uniref:non-ribosomal peptide synthetase n=1 Tax=Chryseobacterium TaxID=59732 RepID=UPI001626942A|nr:MULTISPECIES: non-ribosomal peptide synthetase [Chryseobacterium]MDM1553022.1 amino acid adenylation domain-containing protein [Chryseobacterium indologenes]